MELLPPSGTITSGTVTPLAAGHGQILSSLHARDFVPAGWTVEHELEVIEFAEMCEGMAATTERSVRRARNKTHWISGLSSLFSTGTIVTPHLTFISLAAFPFVMSGLGVLALVFGGTGWYRFSQRHHHKEQTAALSLKELAKQMREEVGKHPSRRIGDPHQMLLGWEQKFTEVVREAIPQVLLEDHQARIREARKKRVKERREIIV
jgi:hypothetical protein